MKTSLLLTLFSVVLFLPASLQAQLQITGKVRNGKSKPLPFSSIQVFENDSITVISYATANKDGKYRIVLPSAGTYVFSAAALGYSRKFRKETISDSFDLDFTLLASDEHLEEVVIKTRGVEAVVRKDTVKYNLAQITDGSEQKLEDIIKKLPGVELDESGKIKAGGKKIDKLLINGKEFFGDQHQLATKNINSEMVGNISLLKNYKDLSFIDDEQTRSGKIALNVDIKGEYSGLFKGELHGEGGHHEKYEASTNLFRFGKKSNLFFIGNLNNMNRQAFTFQDYIAFMGGIFKLMGDKSSITLSEDDLPFLLNDNKIKEKRTRFGALNFVLEPSPNLQINAYTIIDNPQQIRQQRITQTILAEQLPLYQLYYDKREHLFLNNSYMDITGKPSKNSVLNYTITAAPSRQSHSWEDTSDSLQIRQSPNKKRFDLQQNLQFKSKIGLHSKLHASAHWVFSSKNRSIEIVSDSKMPAIEYSKFRQKTEKQSLGGSLDYAFRWNKYASFRFSYRFSHREESFISSSEIRPDSGNNLFLITNTHHPGFSIYQRKWKKINYEVGGDYALIFSSAKSALYSFLPYASVSFHPNNIHNLSLAYRRTHSLPDLPQLAPHEYVSNYRNRRRNLDCTPLTEMLSDNLELDYWLYDAFSGTSFSFNAEYSIDQSPQIEHIDYKDEYILHQYTTGLSEETAFRLHIRLSKRFDEFPFKFKFSGSFHETEYTSSVGNKVEKLRSNKYKANIRCESLFAQSPVNFLAGFRVKKDFLKKQADAGLLFMCPYAELRAVYAGFKLQVKFETNKYKSENYNNTEHILFAKLLYQYPNSRWRFCLVGENTLNMNTLTRIDRYIESGILHEEHCAVQGGSLTAGITYQF
ncbi:MAG: hypothetical protein CSB06_00715 [Bacteroidia bacterium]|nr:MAG: hypothetical protein CSB06_00715 [Bacteroidia bacterium]